MTRDKGKRLANVMSETALSDKLSSDPMLDRPTQTRIGDQLRAMYDDLVHQPVPDRFKDLLARLELGKDEEKDR